MEYASLLLWYNEKLELYNLALIHRKSSSCAEHAPISHNNCDRSKHILLTSTHFTLDGKTPGLCPCYRVSEECMHVCVERKCKLCITDMTAWSLCLSQDDNGSSSSESLCSPWALPSCRAALCSPALLAGHDSAPI